MEYENFQQQLDAEERFLAEYEAHIAAAEAELVIAQEKVNSAQGPLQYRPALLERDAKKKIVDFLKRDRPQTEQSLRRAMESAQQSIFSAKTSEDYSNAIRKRDDAKRSINRLIGDSFDERPE